jgi:hypothetical protein
MRNQFDHHVFANQQADNDHQPIAFASRKLPSSSTTSTSTRTTSRPQQRQRRTGEGKSVSVDDFLAEELNQLSINERAEIIHVLKDTGVETDEHLSLAKELNKMSLKERERILHDIHGVAETVQETPKLIETSLKKLQDALRAERGGGVGGASSSSPPKSQAYDMAASVSPDYVNDDRLRLSFLGAAQFDSKAAARRILDFFTLKLDLFGPDKLCRDIKIEDLDEDDIESLENGHMQLLPTRDQAGRAIMACLSPWIPAKRVESIVLSAYEYCTLSISFSCPNTNCCVLILNIVRKV